MTKQYRTKQTVIDEQAVEIEGLKETIEELSNLPKQCRTKQTVIDEQKKQIKDLEENKTLQYKLIEEEKNLINTQKTLINTFKDDLKKECEKMYNMRAADIVITVFEEDYVVNKPSLILSQTSLYKEDFYIDQPEMVEKALKLRDSLSEFYQHHNMDVRISVSINSI